MSVTWPRVELEQLTESGRSVTYGVVKPGPEVEGGIRLVRGGDVVQGRIAIDSLRTISLQLSQVYKRTVLKGGELLMSLVGNPGEVAIAPRSLEGANIARQVGLIALGPRVEPRFVMYFLMSPEGRSALFTRTGGAVQQVINLSQLATVKVPVPMLSVQSRIADTLAAYDDLIENNRRRMALLEEAARQLYQEWFVRLRFPGNEHTRIKNRVPDGWERRTLGECLTLKRGHDLPESKRVFGAVPVVSSSGITGFHNEKKADGPGIVTGRYGTLGTAYYVEDDYWPHNTALYVSDFKANSPRVLLYFLRDTLQDAQGNNAAVPGLNRNVLHAMELLWPPKRLLNDFDAFLEPLIRQLGTLRRMNERLRSARDLLLPRLMSGEIAV